MSEVQTQVLSEPQQTFSLEYIQNQSKVAEFKELLAESRSARFALVQELRALYVDIQGVIQSRADLLNQFQSEAITMYPELAVKNLADAVNSAPEDHPLVILWANYSDKLSELKSHLDSAVDSFNQKKEAVNQILAQEKSVIQAYAEFAARATTAVPSVQEMVSELVAVEDIPRVEESSVIVDFPAIEVLSPLAADMVMMQALSSEEAGQGEGDADSGQIYTMQAESLSYAQEMRNLDAGEVPSSEFKPLHLALLAAAIAYAIL